MSAAPDRSGRVFVAGHRGMVGSAIVRRLDALGYGDIVMSEEHRLLGALEAANGVLMFGLSAGAILSVMNGLFNRHKGAISLKDRMQSDG